MKEKVYRGIEDEYFGVLLGLWVGILTQPYFKVTDDTVELLFSLNSHYILYLIAFVGGLICILKYAFYLNTLHRIGFYLIALFAGLCGTLGLKFLNPSIAKNDVIAYLGLLIFILWIFIIEFISIFVRRNHKNPSEVT